MVFAQVYVWFENGEIKVSESQSYGCEYISHKRMQIMILWRLILGNDVKYKGEHQTSNCKEQHKNAQICSDIYEHCHYETEFLYDPHEEEGLYQTCKNGQNHDGFGLRGIRVICYLVPDAHISHCYLQDVYPVF